MSPHAYAYRPRVHLPNNVAFGLPNPVAIAMRSDAPPIRLDWRSGDHVGISTDDLDEALAWVAGARALGLVTSHVPGGRGYKPILPPLRLIVERGAGSSVLECGHVVNTPSHTDTLRARCTACLPLKTRLAYIERKRIQIAAALMRWRP